MAPSPEESEKLNVLASSSGSSPEMESRRLQSPSGTSTVKLRGRSGMLDKQKESSEGESPTSGLWSVPAPPSSHSELCESAEAHVADG